jgi:hypothetical protein
MRQTTDFQKPIDRHVQRRIDYAPDWCFGHPFPSKVPITENEMKGRFEGLKVFIGLKNGSSEHGNAYANK